MQLTELCDNVRREVQCRFRVARGSLIVSKTCRYRRCENLGTGRLRKLQRFGIAGPSPGEITAAALPRCLRPQDTGAPVMTLDDTANCPATVAISPKGVVAVTNYSATPCVYPSQGGGVSFYAKNSTTACKTLFADPSKFSFVYGSAFDHAGNLYITGVYGSDAGILGKIEGGCNAKKIKILSTTNTINTAYGIQIDKAGRIAVLDSYDISYPFSYIYIYNPPIKGSLGTPVSTTSLDVQNETTSFAFVASGKALYATELGGRSVDYVDRYDYPAGGAPEQIITVEGAAGNYTGRP